MPIIFLILVLNVINVNYENSISFIGIFFVCIIRLLPATNRILQSIQALRFGQSTLNILKKEFDSKDIIRPTISNNISKDFDENFKNLNFKNVYFLMKKIKRY